MLGPITVKTLLRWIETSMDDVLPEDLKSYKLALGQAVIVPYHTKDLEKAVRCRPVLPEDDSSIPEISEHQLIEGGDYIIDQTVQELARRTDSDVVVLDAVQLAAGEWGAFGKGM